MKKISIVIPVYRNQGSIEPTYKKIKKELNTNCSSYDYEFCFINDGSDDGSQAEIEKICRSDPKVLNIKFVRNFGQVPAIVAGMRHVEGDVAINISADMQDPPQLISQMIKEWENGNKIVICNRLEREDGFIEKLTSRIFYKLMKISIGSMPKGGFDCVLMDKIPLKIFNLFNEKNRFFQGDILWMGFSIKFIPYTRERREIGTSQWTLSKKIKYFIDGILTTSYIPLRLMSFLGIATSLLGFIYAFVVFISRIFNETPFKGWTPIVMLLLIIGGVIMLMLGIIGEYIWRIYDETRNKPYYIIEGNESE